MSAATTPKRKRSKGTPKHGTVSRYTNQSCRCWRCRKAASERGREYRARKKAEAEAAMIHECPMCQCGAA